MSAPTPIKLLASVESEIFPGWTYPPGTTGALLARHIDYATIEVGQTDPDGLSGRFEVLEVPFAIVETVKP